MAFDTKRCDRAWKAIAAYEAAHPHAGKFEDLSAVVADCLADVMHLCAAAGIDFEDRVKLAREFFDEERGEIS